MTQGSPNPKPRRPLFDFNHPFYRPLWRRVVIVAFCFGWAAVEVVNQAPFWAVLFGGLGALSGYHFFLAPPKEDDTDNT